MPSWQYSNSAEFAVEVSCDSSTFQRLTPVKWNLDWWVKLLSVQGYLIILNGSRMGHNWISECISLTSQDCIIHDKMYEWLKKIGNILCIVLKKYLFTVKTNKINSYVVPVTFLPSKAIIEDLLKVSDIQHTQMMDLFF